MNSDDPIKNQKTELEGPPSQNDDLIENKDFYIDENGLFILTKSFLERRGSCCQLGCKHCPYGFREKI